MPSVLVFGATSGIGKALAHLYLKKGYTVFGTGRRVHLMQDLTELYNDQFFPLQHDITSSDTKTIFENIKLLKSSIDIVILNSGVGHRNSNLSWPIDEEILITNVLGVTRYFYASFDYFQSQSKKGKIAVISSVAGIRGSRFAPGYAASKSYLSNLCEGLRCLAQHKRLPISITLILPGFVDTAMADRASFWKAPVEKAALQIFKAIESKKRKAYITRRWSLIGFILKLIPSALYERF